MEQKLINLLEYVVGFSQQKMHVETIKHICATKKIKTKFMFWFHICEFACIALDKIKFNKRGVK